MSDRPDLSDIAQKEGPEGIRKRIEQAKELDLRVVPPGSKPAGTNGVDAKEVLDGLKAFIAEVKEAPQSERPTVLLKLTDDQDRMERLAKTYRKEREQTEVFLTELFTVRGLAKHRANVMKRLKRMAIGGEVVGMDGIPTDDDLFPSVTDVLEPIIQDHDLPSSLTVPWGWQIGPGGIAKVEITESGDTKTKSVSDSPILITGRLKSVQSDQTSMHIEWYRRGKWLNRIVPRHHLMTKRNVELLSEYDLPVSSLTSGAMVKYFTDFESQNQAAVPTASVSSRMGMIGDDPDDMVFLWGNKVITAGGEVGGDGTELSKVPPSQWRQDWIHLHAEEGMKQVASGFHSAGTWERWLEVAEIAASYPKVMAAIYASAVPPLLAIIRDAPNFCIDWAGTTSLGKTTTLRIAASMWGQPDERRPGPIATWDSTRVGVERRSALFGTLPVILDDTKKANKWDDLGQMVYDIASGHGRTRGSMNSLRETAMYRTVLLSSGESPLNKSTKDGGARARIVQIWGSPFDRTDANDEVAKISQLIIGNYGHCGPRLVQILLNNKDRWPLLDAMYRKACFRLSEEAVGNPIASRLATYVATMYVASKVLHQWVGLPEVADPACPDPILSLYHLAMDEAQGSNLASDAMQDVLGWAVSYQDTFWGQHTRHSRWGTSAPSRGWSGVWNGPFDHLFIITSKLKEVLHRHGYEPVGVIRQWHDLGWLVEPEGGSTSGRPDTVRRINGRPSRCIGISRKAIDAFSSVDPG